MVNFKIIENGESYWDKEPELIKLYNNPDLTVKQIQEKMGISGTAFCKLVKKCKNDGSIKPRRQPNQFRKPRKAKPEPKYYQKQYGRRGFQIIRRGKYYGYVSNKRQAERFVELMKECDWDYNKRHEVKEKVMQEDLI